MKTVSAEFLAPWQPSRRLWAFAAVAAVTSLSSLVLAWNASRSPGLAQPAQAGVESPAHAPPTNGPVPLYDRTARHLLKEHASPWPSMLLALERTRVEGTTLQRLDFSVDDEVLRITFTAKNQATALAFIAGLGRLAVEANESSSWRLVTESLDTSTGLLTAVARVDLASRPGANRTEGEVKPQPLAQPP